MFNKGDKVVYFGYRYDNLISGKSYTVSTVMINTRTQVESLLLENESNKNSYFCFYFMSEKCFRKEKLEKLKNLE